MRQWSSYYSPDHDPNAVQVLSSQSKKLLATLWNTFLDAEKTFGIA